MYASIEDFLSTEEERKNEWVSIRWNQLPGHSSKRGRVDIYVRKTMRFIPLPVSGQAIKPVRRNVLDLANMTATPSGKGMFTAILPTIIALAATHDLWLRAENVMNVRFQDFWRRQGWIEVYDAGDTEKVLPSFWYGPHWRLDAGPYSLLAYRSVYDNRMILEVVGPYAASMRPEDSLPNTEPTIHIYVNETSVAKCSDEDEAD